jgi:uncharacterized protein (DUF2336 family)
VICVLRLFFDDEWIWHVSISAEFFAFAREASASARAAGVSSLICDYLHMDLRAEEALEVESILSLLLEDPSPLVRRAMAEGLATEPGAPRHIILSLAADQSDIAALVLQHSPHFSDAELAEIALFASVGPQLAIARRSSVATPVCTALSEAGPPCVLIELAANPRASLTQAIMMRMLERAGGEGRLRDALLMRADAGAQVRLLLLDHVSDALSVFLKQTGWLAPERAERMLREARERAIVELGVHSETPQHGAAGAALSLVRHLRGQGQLTPALILRALLCGDRLMLAAALAELATQPMERVQAHLAHPEGHAFAALYERAGLPENLQPVFIAVLRAAARLSPTASGVPDGALVRTALRASADLPGESRLRLEAWLGRLEAESARLAARRAVPAPL